MFEQVITVYTYASLTKFLKQFEVVFHIFATHKSGILQILFI